jgi:hypothetical protein
MRAALAGSPRDSGWRGGTFRCNVRMARDKPTQPLFREAQSWCLFLIVALAWSALLVAAITAPKVVEVPGFEPEAHCEGKLLADWGLIEGQLVGTSKPEKVPAIKRGQYQGSGQLLGNPNFRAVWTGIFMLAAHWLRALLASSASYFELPIFAFGFVWRVDRKFRFAPKHWRFLCRNLPANELDTCHDRGTVAYVVTQSFYCSIA